MNHSSTNFWSAIGPLRRQVLIWLVGASLIFAVLPVLFDDATVMAIYASLYGVYAIGDGLCALYQVFSGRISGVVCIYRLWHAFVVLLLLLLAFGLGGLATLISR
jgi:hypothetical protein